MSIAAAVFDMDGVIFDTEQLFFEALRRAAAETGHEVTRDVFIETLGLPRRSIPGALERTLGPHFPAPRGFWTGSSAWWEEIVSRRESPPRTFSCTQPES
ncbi:MAG: HAD hydrolase-like protein, partial [Spirochaetaceae bacterium]